MSVPVLALAATAATLAVLTLFALPADAQAQELRFIERPTDTAAGAAFDPTVIVGVFDSGGNLYPAGSYTVTLTLNAPSLPTSCPGTFGGATRPCGRLLFGSTSGQQGAIQATTASGVAAFTGLRVDALGRGYQISASASGLTSATSPVFDVMPGPDWRQHGQNARHTGSNTFAMDMAAPTSAGDIAIASTQLVGTPLVLDLDRDGLLDVVVGVGFQNQPNGQVSVRALRQTSPGTFAPYWTYSPIGAFTNHDVGRVALAAGDFDGDGWKDIVLHAVTSNSGTQCFNRQVAIVSGTSGTALATWTPTGRVLHPIPPVVGDVTGDGVDDIVLLAATVCYSNSANRLYVLTSNSLTEYASGGFPGLTHNCAPAVACTYGAGAVLATAPPVLAELRSTHPGLEIVVGTNNAGIEWGIGIPPGQIHLCAPTPGSLGCSETANFAYTVAQDQQQTTPQVTGLAIGDIDGSGSPRLVVNARYRTNHPVTQQPSTLAVFQLVPSLAFQSSRADGFVWNTPAVGTYDGDGIADILNVKYSTDSLDTKQGDVHVRGFASGAITAKATLLRPQPAGQPSTQSFGGALVDVDATGGPKEFVFASDEGKVTAVKDAASVPVTLWEATQSAQPTTTIAIASLSADCRPGIVVGLANGNLARLVGLPAAPPAIVPDLNGVIVGPSWASPGPGLQAKLHWTAPSNGGLPILDYRVYRSTAASGPYTEIGIWRGATPPTAAAPFVDPVPAAGDYYYKVTAVNCVGESAAQPNPFWADVRPAAVPTQLSGTVGDLTSPQRRVQLTWTSSQSGAPRANGCGPADAYWVFRGTAATFTPDTTGFTNRIATVAGGGAASPTALAYTDTGLVMDGDYYYKVIATNCVGTSPAAGPFWAEVRGPSAPSLVSTAVSAGTPSVAVTWSAAPANAGAPNGCGAVLRYRVYRSINAAAGPFGPTPLATVTHPTATYTDTAVTSGRHYYYKVAAVNCVGESQAMPVGSGAAADLLPPATPTATASGVASDRIDVAWSMPEPADPASDGPGVGVARYELYWQAGPGVTPASNRWSPDPTAVPTAALAHMGRTVATEYCYRIRAVDANGNLGLLSTEACAVAPDTTPPATVTDLAATATEYNRIALTWTAATDNLAVTGYEVYWQSGPGVSLSSARLAPDPGAAATGLVHTGRAAETEYCYRIRAYDAAGNRAGLSAETCATTPAPPGIPPSFVLATGIVTVAEDAGPVTVPAFAQDVAAGIPTPSPVSVRFIATVLSNPGLFAGGALPAISPSAFAPAPWSGTLTFRTGPDQCGQADVQIVLRDDGGGTSRLDTSEPQVFTIAVTCVNDPPRFEPQSTSIATTPGAGPVVLPGWASGAIAGPASALDETTGPGAQRLRFQTVAFDAGLFATQPTVAPAAPAPFALSPTGDLSFTPSSTRFGATSVQICLHDDGGTAAGGIDSFCRTLEIRIVGPSQPQPDCFVVRGSLRVPAPGVAVNDVASGPLPAVRLDAAPLHALRFDLRADGGFDYTPVPGFDGMDRFSYRAQSGPFLSDPVEVCLRVDPAGGPSGPEARIAFSPAAPRVGEPVTFWDTSVDGDGTIATQEWSFGPEDLATGPATTRTFDSAGTYRVTLSVRDDAGFTDSDTVSVTVAERLPANPAAADVPAQSPRPPSPPGDGSPREGLPSAPGSTGFAADAEGLTVRVRAGTAGALAYHWEFGDGSTAFGSTAQHMYAAAGTYTIRLEVVTDVGVARATRDVTVVAVDRIEPTEVEPAERARETEEATATGVSSLAWGLAGAGATLAAAVLGALFVLVGKRRRNRAADAAPASEPPEV